MNNILIIGARGLGRSVHEYLKDLRNFNTDFVIKGFLDDNSDALSSFDGYAPIISSVEDYNVQSGDLFICALGDIKAKVHYSSIIKSKGGSFFTLIHPLAKIAHDAIIGEGSIIQPYVLISTNVSIGEQCLIQAFSVIGHDVSIGDYSRVDTHVVCAGGARIGSNVSLFTGSIINQRAIVEDDCNVGAGCFVVKRVKRGTTVYGNPSREL